MSELAAIKAIAEDNTAGVFSLSADTLAVLLFALGFIHDLSAWRDFPDEPLSDVDIDKIDSLIANATYEVMTPVTIPDPAIYPDHFLITPEEMATFAFGYAVTHDSTVLYAQRGEVTPIGDGTTMLFPIFCRAGSYDLSVRGWRSVNFGKVDYYIDSVLVASGQDWYNGTFQSNFRQTLSISVASDGAHLLSIVVNGKNASSSGFRFVFISAVGYVNA